MNPAEEPVVAQPVEKSPVRSEEQPIEKPTEEANKSALKEGAAQSTPMTEEERKAQEANRQKDRSPFTLRGFLHDNVSQAISKEPRPKAAAKKAEGVAGEGAEKPAEKPAEEEKPLVQKIKDVFTGSKQTPPPKAEEEGAKAAEEENTLQGPGI